jgi:hypothetical protein
MNTITLELTDAELFLLSEAVSNLLEDLGGEEDTTTDATLPDDLDSLWDKFQNATKVAE